MSRLRLKIEGKPGEITLDSFVGVLNRARLILADLDSAISENPRGSLEWYVANLEIGSAVAEIESKPKPSARGVTDRLGVMVNENFVAGLEAINGGEHLPPYFGDLGLGRVKAISSLVKKAGEGHDFVATHLNHNGQKTARVTVETGKMVRKLLLPHFQSIGSITGKLEVVSVHGPAQFNVYESRTRRAVRCRFPKERLEEVSAALGKRVTVTGIVSRNRSGDPLRVDKPEIRILTGDSELPTARDLLGLVPDLTGDLSSEEYVRRLRNG